LRVRGFTQDDSHIFIAQEMLTEEITRVVKVHPPHAQQLRLHEFEVYVSTRPKDSIGDPALWESATQALKDALDAAQWPYQIDEGGGRRLLRAQDRLQDQGQHRPHLAVQHAAGRSNLPERFKLEYVASDGTRKRPIMLHRALLGSLERFFGILVEHYAGAFPAWLAPVQARILTITNDLDPQALALQAELAELGFRVECDLSGEKINAKRARRPDVPRSPIRWCWGRKRPRAARWRCGAMERRILRSCPRLISIAQLQREVKERK